MRTLSTLLFAVSILIQCRSSESNYSPEQHLKEVSDWHQKRMANLRKKESWINLNGLFFLKEGLNTFGSGKNNDLVFPKEFPVKSGILSVQNGKVSLTLNSSISEEPDGLTQGKIYDEKLNFKKNQLYKGHQWFIVKRNGMYAVRMRDFNHPNFAKLKTIERFPVNLKWRFAAKLNPFDKPRTLVSKNVLDLTEERTYSGELVFQHEGTEYRVLAEEYDDQWFLIFKDATSGNETYESSRYLLFPAPDKNGNTFIDFNQTYNPPCSFTEFATCLLPLKQNTFAFRMEAGEKFDPNWNK